jgi:hypothetical protein
VTGGAVISDIDKAVTVNSLNHTFESPVYIQINCILTQTQAKQVYIELVFNIKNILIFIGIYSELWREFQDS